MNRTRRLSFRGVLVGLGAFVLLQPVFSQTPPPAEPSPIPPAPVSEAEMKRKAALKDKAFSVLEDTFKEIGTLKLPENRSRLQMIAADMLWERDPEKARTLFSEAFGNLGEAFKQTQGDDEDDDGQVIYVQFETYQAALGQVARRDPKLAFELLRSTRKSYFPNADGNVSRALDRAEFDLMRKVAANDPEKLLRFAEEYLEKGVTYEVFGLIQELVGTDEKTAAKLIGQVTDKLRPETIRKDPQIGNIVLQLLNLVFGPNSKMRPLVGDQVARELVSTSVRAVVDVPQNAAAMTFNPFTYELIRSLRAIPEIGKLVPDQAVALQAKFSEFDKTFGGVEKLRKDYESLMSEGSVDKLLDAAKDSGENDYLIQAAIEKAIRDGDLDRARRIASEKISDPDRRRLLLESIDQQALSKKIEQGNVEEARLMVSQLRSKRDRIAKLIELARESAARKDVPTALDLLREARNQLPGRPTNDLQWQAMLDSARLYAEIGPDEAFGILEPLADQFNEMAAAMAVLDGFMRYGPAYEVRNNEFILTRQGRAVEMTDRWAAVLGLSAAADFDRAAAAADRLQRPEFRLSARLELLRKLLVEEKPADGKKAASDKETVTRQKD